MSTLLEPTTAALIQSQAQTDVMVRNMDPALSKQKLHTDLARALAQQREQGTLIDWSAISDNVWENVQPTPMFAVMQLARVATIQTNLLCQMANAVDENTKRLARMEDTLARATEAISRLTGKVTEHDVVLERSERSVIAFKTEVEQELRDILEKQDKLQNELRFVHTKVNSFNRFDETLDKMSLQLREVVAEELPMVKRRLDRVTAYEGNLQAALSQVKELQEGAIAARYQQLPGPVGLGMSGSIGGGGAHIRSSGRWIWEGGRVLNSRSALVPWDSRCLESGEGLRWSKDDKSYAIEVRKGGLYKLSFGAITTNPSTTTDIMKLYVDDDALLSSVYAATFVAHASGRGALTLKSQPNAGQVRRLDSTRSRQPYPHCSASTCTASSYTSLSSADFIYLPSRALLCVQCTVNPADIVCGFLEIHEFA